mgnify:CR=1 FL=1
MNEITIFLFGFAVGWVVRDVFRDIATGRVIRELLEKLEKEDDN